jgi:malate synthase
VQRGAAAVPESLSEADLREMMRLASTYIDTWLNRRILFAPEVTAPEDAWAQVWLWLKRAAQLDDGRILTQELLEALYADEMTKVR